MRVLWLSHFVPFPPKGGALQRSHYLLRAAARRHEVHLVTLNQRAILKHAQAVEEAREALRGWCPTLEIHPIPADRSPLHWAAMAAATALRAEPYDVNWLRSRPLLDAIRARAARERYDLIHVDTLGMLPYAEAFGGVPWALNHHNVESQMMARRAGAERRRWLRAYLRREAAKLAAFERASAPRAAVNLMVSELDAERLREVAGSVPTAVVPNGVDLAYFAPRRQPGAEGDGLVFVGGMHWYPNREAVRLLLGEIWPRLRQDGRDRRLTVVGQDPLPELRRATRTDRVAAPGFVDDVRPYVERATVFVCPIRDGGGTRLKVLDALAMAKPLVATALSVEGLGLEDGRHYLRAETPDEFVAAIRRLESDPTLRRRLSVEGRRLVGTRYTWDAVGERLLDAYAAAVGGSGVTRAAGSP